MRQLLKSLAADGRSVFVSSHLLSEMALMADELVVIGKGRMIASGPVADFVKNARTGAVLVHTPQAADLAALLTRQPGVTVASEAGGLRVMGMEAQAIGDLAFDNRIRLHELATQMATLEEAFLEATAGAEEFQAHQLQQAPPGPPGPPKEGPK
jgi:ABC-2 type transport system ATP-binding protein